MPALLDPGTPPPALLGPDTPQRVVLPNLHTLSFFGYDFSALALQKPEQTPYLLALASSLERRRQSSAPVQQLIFNGCQYEQEWFDALKAVVPGDILRVDGARRLSL